MSYSDFFKVSNSGQRVVLDNVYGNYGGSLGWRQVPRVESMGGIGSSSGGMDKVMAGYDDESQALTEQLQAIYDSYQGYVDNYSDDIKPIMESMDGDIRNIESYIDDYSKSLDGYNDALGQNRADLDEMRSTFMEGIELDPSASHRRAEYMGGVAAQYGAAEDSIKREMAGQGVNYYANAGASRDFKLKRAAGLADASNRAYGDWREQHNQDVMAQQHGMATYAGMNNAHAGAVARGVDLKSREGDAWGNVLNARSGMANMHRGVLDARLAAESGRADGVQRLLELNENRRSETLGLEAMKTQNKLTAKTANGGTDTSALFGMEPVSAYNPNNPFNR
jgi:hypothetical protein